MGIKQRLYPDIVSEQMLIEHCRHERFLWNLSIEQFEFARRYRPFRCGKRQAWPPHKQRGHQLTELRKELDWLRAGSQTAQQQALRIVDRAYRNWWSNPTHFRRPDFRSRHHKLGFSVVGAGTEFRVVRLSRKWAHIKLPKIAALIKFRVTVDWSRIAACRSVRVTCDRAGIWYVSFPEPQPTVERTRTGNAVGVDRGVANTMTLSNGDMSNIAAFTPKQSEREIRLQRKLGRQSKGSARRQRTKNELGRLRRKQECRRTNWVEQTSTRLVVDYDLVVFEKLRTSNMVRSAAGTVDNPGRNVAQKRGLNRSIHAQRWAALVTRVEQKAATCEVEVIEIPAAFTSQRCSHCNHTDRRNRESQAVFKCRGCGATEHADVNAAINILAAGLAVAGRGDLPAIARSVKRQPLAPTK